MVIGAGGREHALCWKIAQSPEVKKLFAAPGNPGIAEMATCLPTTEYLVAAESASADLTIVGPEVPLAAGIVDAFRSAGRPIVGPRASAARLESSKAFAKTLMERAHIPSARFRIVDNLQDAQHVLKSFSLPVVLKADGLAAGKGVIIARSEDEAHSGIAQLLQHTSRLVIEEFLEGEEVSFIVLSDGKEFVALEPSQDHKTVFDDDCGPNTGGMGAYADGRILRPEQKKEIADTVIRPTLDALSRQGTPFTGFLYAGLMMTRDGPRVLEFNVRLGDPETQVLMHRMQSDFVPYLVGAAHGALPSIPFELSSNPSVCVVLAAAGYPGQVRTGDEIHGLENVSEAAVFHAGTKVRDNVLVTGGGRVLGITSSGPDLARAIESTYADVKKVHFDGMHYRHDIGRKGLKRW